MKKLTASLSLDLDNKWAYLRTHGVRSWEQYPSYLDSVVPRVIDCCAARELSLTCFVVGRDAQREQNHHALAAIADAGHEIGNHSLNHYPWMHTLHSEEVEAEITAAEEYIELATGQTPVGFRGPGYSLSSAMVSLLSSRGYEYDATTLPTYIGPFARWYFRRTASKAAVEQADRRQLFGSWKDGLRPNRPFYWSANRNPLIEIPVTTFPVVKVPIHMTYLLQLWQVSPRLTRAYLRTAFLACKAVGIGPSVILHPLDFLGAEDEPEMRFFPGMALPRASKSQLLGSLLDRLASMFRVVPIREHAAEVRRGFRLPQPTGRSAPLRAETIPALAAKG